MLENTQDTTITPTPQFSPIELSQHQAKTLKWVTSAQSKDDSRPTLTGTHVNGFLVATDGFRLHAIPGDDMLFQDSLEDTVVNFGKIPASGGYIKPELTEDAGPYPDVIQIIPTSDPVFEIVVNPKLLLEVLRGLSGMVKLSFYGDSSPMEVRGKIEGKYEDPTPTYSLIMPMHLGHNGGELDPDWTPE